MNEGLRILKAEDVTQEWRDKQQPPKSKEDQKNDILLQLKKSDTELIRLIEDLTAFCEGLGFVTPLNKKTLIEQRKQLRDDIATL